MRSPCELLSPNRPLLGLFGHSGSQELILSLLGHFGPPGPFWASRAPSWHLQTWIPPFQGLFWAIWAIWPNVPFGLAGPSGPAGPFSPHFRPPFWAPFAQIAETPIKKGSFCHGAGWPRMAPVGKPPQNRPFQGRQGPF